MVIRLLKHLLAALFLLVLITGAHAEIALAATNIKNSPIKFGVLGDSDSHSFHDEILLNEPEKRGGKYRPVTYQWTEIISRLRPRQIDMGGWGKWGVPEQIAKLLDMLGLEYRAPRKEDYRYNLAISGAKCENLTMGTSRQTQRLVYLMDQDNDAWANGVVTIRIGINSIGVHKSLARFAHSGLTSETQQEVSDCAAYVRESVKLIRANHPATRIVLVGILNDSDFVPWIADWHKPQELQNIAAVLDAYDAILKQLAMADLNILFWDDRAWFANYFGGRDSVGAPHYHGTQLDGPTPITYTQGDVPTNAILADGHAGTVWNGLWARDLLEALNHRFGYAFTALTQAEIAALADPDAKLGIAVPTK